MEVERGTGQSGGLSQGAHNTRRLSGLFLPSLLTCKMSLFYSRRTRRQLWRDRLAKIGLEDLERGALLGVGGFGRWEGHH